MKNSYLKIRIRLFLYIILYTSLYITSKKTAMKKKSTQSTADSYKGLSAEQRKALFDIELSVMKFSKETIDAFAVRKLKNN